MFKGIFTVITAIAALSIFMMAGGCASMVPPSGGPKDSVAPVLVSVNPPGGSTHFNSKKITLTFNEYVELNDAMQNMVISPLPTIMPDVQRKLKTITIKFRDSLLPNTTYAINFKNAVKDITEGNRAKDLFYVVTTGEHFDSLQLSGRVLMANTQKPDSTLTAMLYADMKDSAVVKSRPRYIAKVDTAGYFLFRFLAPGSYRLYAIKDEGGSYMYTSTSKPFAFYNEPVTISATTTPEARKMYASAIPEVKPYEEPEEEDDKKKDKRLKFATNINNNKLDLLMPLQLNFERPVKNWDAQKMALYTDSAYTSATGYTFTLDSMHRQLTMNMPWQESKAYHLILQKDFATDSANRQLLKADTLHFTTMGRKEYGRAKITFPGLDMSRNPVLLIRQGDVLKGSFPLTSKTIQLQLFLPGEYTLALLLDTNKNGVWDPGSLFQHRQPELIVPLERKLNIKPDWDTEFEIPVTLPSY